MTGPRIDTRWWAMKAVDRDVVEVFCVRYYFGEHDGNTATNPNRPTRMEYLAQAGGWVAYAEGFVIQPALVIPGFLMFSLPKMQEAYPSLEAQEVMRLLSKVWLAA